MSFGGLTGLSFLGLGLGSSLGANLPAGIKPEGNPDIKYVEGKRRSSKRRARRQRGKGMTA